MLNKYTMILHCRISSTDWLLLIPQRKFIRSSIMSIHMRSAWSFLLSCCHAWIPFSYCNHSTISRLCCWDAKQTTCFLKGKTSLIIVIIMKYFLFSKVISIDMLSLERNYLLVKTYLIGGPNERILPPRDIAEVHSSNFQFRLHYKYFSEKRKDLEVPTLCQLSCSQWLPCQDHQSAICWARYFN
jgi:hypothetical protein